MVMSADDLIRGLNKPFLTKVLDEKTEALKAKSVDIHPATNSGTLMDVEMVVAVAEKPIAPVHVGPIRPSIDTIKGAELSLWRMGDRTDVVLRDLQGNDYYGALVGPLAAEGAFGVPNNLEDKAFLKLIYDAYIQDAQVAELDSGDFNYCMAATALWTNRDRTGTPVPRSFLIMNWKTLGSTYMPSEALLLDGSKNLTFKMERETVKNPRQPQWKGRAR